MATALEETKKLNAFISYILLKYKEDTWFKTRSIISTIVNTGFPYERKIHYQTVTRFIRKLCDKKLLIKIDKAFETEGGVRGSEYRIININALHIELKDHMALFYGKKQPNTKVVPLNSKLEKVSTLPEPTNHDTVLYDKDIENPDEEFMLVILEMMESNNDNEFTVDGIYDSLYSDGFKITIQQVRRIVAGLAKDLLIRLAPNSHIIYRVISHSKFYKLLDSYRRKEIKAIKNDPKLPEGLKVAQTGAAIHEYINYLHDEIKRLNEELESSKCDLENSKVEGGLYKDEYSALEERLKAAEDLNFKQTLLIQESGLDQVSPDLVGKTIEHIVK